MGDENLENKDSQNNLKDNLNLGDENLENKDSQNNLKDNLNLGDENLGNKDNQNNSKNNLNMENENINNKDREVENNRHDNFKMEDEDVKNKENEEIEYKNIANGDDSKTEHQIHEDINKYVEQMKELNESDNLDLKSNEIQEQNMNNEYINKNEQLLEDNVNINKNLNDKRFKKSHNYNQKIISNKAKIIKGQKIIFSQNKTKKEYQNNQLWKAKNNIIVKHKNNYNILKENNHLNFHENSMRKEISSEKIESQKDKESLSKKSRTSKTNIFNNKKNNDICSELLKTTMKNEKKLYLIPYATKKEKINKTFHTIGDANGISYQSYSVIDGNVIEDNLVIVRDNDKKSITNLKNSIRFMSSTSKKIASQNKLQNSNKSDLKEVNIQDFNFN
jgi:hypothetical protein